MFSSKLEVDRHVDICLRKINSETERNLRCLAFAKLYYKVSEYEQARRYVTSYLSTKPLSAEGQLLLGNILEKLGNLEAALDAYRSSFELDSKQNSLVIKICELLAKDVVNLDIPAAKFFCEKAQSLEPHNPSVFTLKERLMNLECRDPNEVTKLILKELDTRPTDVKLRIRLLRHFLQNNQIKEAYKHAADIEERNLSVFLNNLSWYETVAEILFRYQRDTSLDDNLGYEFWILLICVLDKVASLNLDEHSGNVKSSTDYVAAVFNFDQMLTLAAQHLNACNDRHLTQEFLYHFRGQLCFHLAVLMYKQAKKGLLQFKEVANIVLPLLFCAYHSQPSELNALWLRHTSEYKKEQLKRWHKESSYRCSQVGHIILREVKSRKSTVVEKALLHSSGLWRDQVFKKLFVTREQQNNIKNSYFVNSAQIADVVTKLPETTEIQALDDEAQLVYPDSLHHYIWLCLNGDLSTFRCTSFHGLQYSVKDLKNCAAETLCILDIQVFIYCASLCAKANIENSNDIAYNISHKPSALPAAVTEQLGTIDQAKWLLAAYKMYRNEYGPDLSEIRLKLIRGIEVIRCVGNHGLDVKLLVTLARTFAECSNNSSKQSEIEGNEARAELYWRTALPLLERLRSNKICTFSGQRLFEYKSKEMSLNEVQDHIDNAKLFIASRLMKQRQHEKALQLLEQLKDPYASYYQANIYKAMAEEQINENKDSVTVQMQNQYTILLTKARDCLYLTLDRLRDPSVDRKHVLNSKLGSEIEEIEHALGRVDSDISNRYESDDLADESESGRNIIQLTPSYSLSQSSFLNGSSMTVRNDSQMSFSTPSRRSLLRTEARPSPERLDAQLRQLIASKDTAISQMMDQNRIIVDSHRFLVDELKGFREAVKGLTSAVGELQTIKNTVEDLKGIKTVVEELKTSVDELQSFRNVTDVVYELKKELHELKKDSHKIKTAHLSDEDLYPLDEEFGNDYNIGSNVSGFNPSLYPHGRIPVTGSFAYGAPALYSPMYQMSPYHYGLGLPPQAGAVPFGAEQIAAELRAINSLPQNLGQGALPQGNYGLLPPLGQPFAQTTLSSATLLPNQPLGPPLFKEGKPEHPVASASAISITNVFSTLSSNTFPLSTVTTSNLSTGTKAAPVNVVITASDPLPTNKSTTVQPILSVTIPPQHLKGNLPPKQQPHNYQIPLPATSVTTVPTPSILNQATLPVSTQSILSNVAPPVFSAIPEKSPVKSTGLGLQIEKSLSQSFTSTFQPEGKSDLNKTSGSTSSVDEIDPCPDFKPIIPLPDEVPVNTGEENEKVLFCGRAKLFRYVDKEWRERGLGDIKILHNPETNKVRILMRRDQIHKICANHFITKNMTLSPMPSNDKAYVWAANDFADQEVVLEKFCVKLKTPEEAKIFYDAFQNAVKLITESEAKIPETTAVSVTTPSSTRKDIKVITATTTAASTAVFGGFVFTTIPTFIPKDENVEIKEIKTDTTPKASPFADFSFGSTASTPSSFTAVQKPATVVINKDAPKAVPASPGDDDHSVSEFEPTVEFKPVVPLPAIVDVKTGEENAEVLHECRARLLRFDSDTKEWKERGIGIMKILKEDKTIRLLMRREQVLKVCCNHLLLKNMSFSKMRNNPKALSWCAQDFSEEVLKTEMFALRFKTEEQATEYLNALQSAQALLNDNNILQEKDTEKKQERNQHAKVKTSSHEMPLDATTKQPSWGEKFKPKSGSWSCKICFIVNESKDNYCVACETPKNHNLPKKEVSAASGPTFSITVPSFTTKPDSFTTQSSSFTFGIQQNNEKTQPSGFGDLFKPKEGSWSCKTCYVTNDADKLYCASCESPKDDTVPKKEVNKGLNFTNSTSTLKFGIQQNTEKAQPSGFGDLFKPKEGSWACKTCYVTNDADKLYCASCESPKDDTVAKKALNKSLNFTNSTSTFKFGIQQTDEKVQTPGFGDSFKPKEGSWSCKICYVRYDADKLYCASCESPKDDSVPKKEPSQGLNLTNSGSSFTFGMPPASDTSNFSFGTKPAQLSTEFVFGAASSANKEAPLNLASKPFTFTSPDQLSKDLDKNNESKSKEPNTEKFIFGSPQKHEFEFTPRSPRRASGCHGEEESDGSFVEEEADNIYFKPVIPLPDKVEVKTGEEAEEVLYCHRAKLFRFVDGEWKERGIGDVKILFHPETKKLRVLMRREQVLKICLNHVLTSDIDYRAKDDKTWLFCAPDFSEGEIVRQQFCLRFKNGEIAQDFKKAVTSALGKIEETDIKAETKADSDIEIVSETKVTTEEEKEAIRLGLPPKFFAYKQLPNCSCDQCKKDDVYLKELFEDCAQKSKEQLTTFLFGAPQSVPATSNTNIFTSTTNKAHLTASPVVSSSTNVNTSQTPTIQELLVKPSVFGDLSILQAKTPVTTEASNAFKSFTFSLNSSQTATTTTVTNKPVFGSGPFAFGSNTSLFGTPATIVSNTASSGAVTTTTATSVFGSNSGLFSTSNTSLFSGGLFKGAGNGESIFGTSNNDNKPTFGTTSIFGSNPSLFESTPAEPLTSQNAPVVSSEKEVILPSDPNLTFASLAATSQNKPAFGKKTDDGKNPFGFLGAGTPVFGGGGATAAAAANKQAAAKKVEKEEAASGDEGENDGAPEDYDPHYEPIVPLPAAIVVSTGEEEETPLFNERAKLFRYDADAKEWKERGVGQMKLLHHPVNNTYRLLLRREQVHKVVLNQLIIPTLDLQPMSTSDKAWCWFGYNYTDDEAALEQLAIRFKNTELAKQFFETVQKAIQAVADYQANKNLPSTLHECGIEDVSGDENQPVVEEVDDDQEEEDDDDDDDEEDDRSVMFTKRCTLSEKLDSGEWKIIAMGDLEVYYDPELYGAKISVTDDNGCLVSNTIIGVNTVMEMSDNECWWRAVEWANEEFQWKTFKATFSSAAAAEEFFCSYKEGANYAMECDIVDEIPTEERSEND